MTAKSRKTGEDRSGPIRESLLGVERGQSSRMGVEFCSIRSGALNSGSSFDISPVSPRSIVKVACQVLGDIESYRTRLSGSCSVSVASCVALIVGAKPFACETQVFPIVVLVPSIPMNC